MLTNDCKVLSSVLTFVRGKRPLIAILGFFANVQLRELPSNLLTTVCQVCLEEPDQDIWHRSVYILTNYVEHQRIDKPKQEILVLFHRIAAECSNAEVRVMAQSLISYVDENY
jgi:hypothetical protein